MSFFQMPSPLAARRLFLGRTGLTLSGAAVALLAGNEALAAQFDHGAHGAQMPGHVGRMPLHQGRLGARGVVLGQAGDGFEQLRAPLVVEVFG